MNYKDLASKTQDYTVEQRRWFHRYPELSLQEVKTTEHIESELRKMGYEEIQRFENHTGLCAMLYGGKAEAGCRTVALRADIDALPVLEKTGLPFASENEGIMHACGHDNHMAMLLGAAKMLIETKDELKGNVKLIFQANWLWCRILCRSWHFGWCRCDIWTACMGYFGRALLKCTTRPSYGKYGLLYNRSKWCFCTCDTAAYGD